MKRGGRGEKNKSKESQTELFYTLGPYILKYHSKNFASEQNEEKSKNKKRRGEGGVTCFSKKQ